MYYHQKNKGLMISEVKILMEPSFGTEFIYLIIWDTSYTEM